MKAGGRYAPAETWKSTGCVGLSLKGRDFANQTKRQYFADGVLPDDLHLLRCVPYFEQRRFRHFAQEPDGPDRDNIDEVHERIRELSGGSVPSPADPLP